MCYTATLSAHSDSSSAGGLLQGTWIDNPKLCFFASEEFTNASLSSTGFVLVVAVVHVLLCRLSFLIVVSVFTDIFNRNSTTLPYFSAPQETYWGQFEDISKYNVHLNLFERLWAAWYAFMQNDVLATGIMSFAMHELVYFGRSIPWAIIDRLPYFNKYKIQNVRCKDVWRWL